MLYQAILLKNHRFDNALVSSESVSSNNIIAFLDRIKWCIGYISDPDEFRNTCVIFRKWKSLLSELHDQYYSPMIDSVPHKQKVESALIYLYTNKITDLDTDVEQSSKMALLSSKIDPYGKYFEESFKALDSDFYSKYAAMKSLQIATSLFKKSNLDESYGEFYKTAECLTQKDNLNAIEGYFCSWALHGLGNIAYVRNQYDSANHLFRESLRIKGEFDGLPEILNYLTKAKIAVTNITEYSTKRWNNELENIYLYFKDDQERLLGQNPDLTHNLEMDFCLHIGKSYAYLDDYLKAIDYLYKGIQLSQQLKNKVGEFRCRIFYSIVKGDVDEEYSVLDKQLSQFDACELSNPYLRKMANHIDIAEIETLSPNLGARVKFLFEKYKIKPLADGILINNAVA